MGLIAFLFMGMALVACVLASWDSIDASYRAKLWADEAVKVTAGVGPSGDEQTKVALVDITTRLDALEYSPDCYPWIGRRINNLFGFLESIGVLTNERQDRMDAAAAEQDARIVTAECRIRKLFAAGESLFDIEQDDHAETVGYEQQNQAWCNQARAEIHALRAELAVIQRALPACGKNERREDCAAGPSEKTTPCGCGCQPTAVYPVDGDPAYLGDGFLPVQPYRPK